MLEGNFWPSIAQGCPGGGGGDGRWSNNGYDVYGARFRQKFTLEDAIGVPRMIA
jgi:hypothetical protein